MSPIEKQPRPAVFLDRDGTIIEDHGNLSDPSQVVFFAETTASLQRLQEHYDLFIVTHQPGVAQGIISLQDVERVNAHIVSYLAEAGVRIVSIYVCPHGRGDGCRCIKPNPYFPRKAAQEHGIDLRRSFVIGDHPHDVELATNAGAQGIYVLTGHGVKHRDQMPEEALVVSGIGRAVELILSNQAITMTRRDRTNM